MLLLEIKISTSVQKNKGFINSKEFVGSLFVIGNSKKTPFT